MAAQPRRSLREVLKSGWQSLQFLSLESATADASWFDTVAAHRGVLEDFSRGLSGRARFPQPLETRFLQFSRSRASMSRAIMTVGTTLMFLLTPLWAHLLHAPADVRDYITQASIWLFTPACFIVTLAQLRWPTRELSEWLFITLFLVEVAAVESMLYIAVALGYHVNPISSVAVTLAVLSLGRLSLARSTAFVVLYGAMIAGFDLFAPSGEPLRHGTDTICIIAMLSIALLATAFAQRNRRQIWALLQLSQASAWLDPLTGLPNRSAFERHVGQALKQGRAGTLALIDLDHFKCINDRYGHLHGDGVLAEVAMSVGSAAQAGDIAARVGGEEFALFLQDCDTTAAAPRLEALRQAIRALEIENPDSPLLTLSTSIGAVELARGETVSDAYDRADQFLYEAKRRGRDTVVLA